MNGFWIGVVVLIVLILAVKPSLGASRVNKATIQEKLKQGAMVVDVRTPEEFESGHYKGAKNIPLQDLKNRLAELGDKTKPIVLHCAAGMRSAQAAKILKAAGFTDVTDAGTLKNLQP